MIKERIIRYQGKKITVLFSVDRCTHYAACLEGAPEVFDSSQRPWVMPDAASPDKVAEVIITCPTGALHFERKDGGAQEPVPAENTLIVETHGPVYFLGDLEVRDQYEKLLLKDTRIAFCRCGMSKVKPFCDNTHARVGFEDAKEIAPDHPSVPSKEIPKGKVTAVLMKDGPIKLTGPVTIKNGQKDIIFQGTKALLCRCGASKHMPFCDGSHRKSDFESELGCVKII
ncbi:CDGSH iron-sulfur domain-containing protein [bacterium]|nr:CDGSH iron-sulfur domain-containing protein [bacterium]